MTLEASDAHDDVSVDVAFKRVHLKALPLLAKLQLVHCADVLVGVQGAGLAHFHFLPPGAVLLEVGWRHWPAGRYSKRAQWRPWRRRRLKQ